MGCVSSSNKCCYRIHCFACVQLPAFSDDEEDIHHVVSLTSTSYGLLNTGTSPPGNLVNICRRPNQYHHIPSCVVDDTESMFVLGKETETINMWELMEGLEDGSIKVICPREKLSLPSETSVSVHARPESAKQWSFEHCTPVWKKYHVYTQADSGTQERLLMINSSSPPFIDSPRNISSACPLIELDESMSISSASDPMEDLRVLLSPLDSPSYCIARCIGRMGFHATSLSLDGVTEHPPKGFHQICLRTPSKSPDVKKKKKKNNKKKRSNSKPSSSSSPDALKKKFSSRQPSSDSMDVGKSRSTSTWSSLDSIDLINKSNSADAIASKGRTPSSDVLMKEFDQEGLFDPSLIATFERALDAAMASGNENDWFQPGTDVSGTNSSSTQTTWVSTDIVSDVDSLRGKAPSAAPTTMMLHAEEDNGKNLQRYELKCPPRGENKVVLYFTSLRGVRRTHEDCCVVRVILRGLGVCVDERDVWMHSKFKEELIELLGVERMGGALHVPQLFIMGRYIGDADKVKRLHEEGILVRLMDGITSSRTPWVVCDGCGDARFIPCSYCCGSCKIHDHHGNSTRCSFCNENGLIMCPTCTI